MKLFLVIFILLFNFNSNCEAEEFQRGIASFYWKHQKTAWGERFKNQHNWCAHKTLPKNTKLKVTNLRNGKSVIVFVKDRGPYIKGRVIDLSKSAFSKIESTKKGLCRVKIEIIK